MTDIAMLAILVGPLYPIVIHNAVKVRVTSQRFADHKEDIQ